METWRKFVDLTSREPTNKNYRGVVYQLVRFLAHQTHLADPLQSSHKEAIVSLVTSRLGEWGESVSTIPLALEHLRNVRLFLVMIAYHLQDEAKKQLFSLFSNVRLVHTSKHPHKWEQLALSTLGQRDRPELWAVTAVETARTIPFTHLKIDRESYKLGLEPLWVVSYNAPTLEELDIPFKMPLPSNTNLDRSPLYLGLKKLTLRGCLQEVSLGNFPLEELHLINVSKKSCVLIFDTHKIQKFSSSGMSLTWAWVQNFFQFLFDSRKRGVFQLKNSGLPTPPVEIVQFFNQYPTWEILIEEPTYKLVKKRTPPFTDLGRNEVITRVEKNT
jgi:hypothetical protein